MLIASSSGDAQEGTTDGEKSIVGALTNQGFENKDTFYGTSGSLYALSPVFHAFSSSGKYLENALLLVVKSLWSLRISSTSSYSCG